MSAPDHIVQIILDGMPEPRPDDAPARARRAADRMWAILGDGELTDPDEQEAQIIRAICSEALSYPE